MPAKKRLVPPIRPSADGSSFLRLGRPGGDGGGAPVRNRSPPPQRGAVPPNDGLSESSRSSSSSASHPTETALPARGQAGTSAARGADRPGARRMAPPTPSREAPAKWDETMESERASLPGLHPSCPAIAASVSSLASASPAVARSSETQTGGREREKRRTKNPVTPPPRQPPSPLHASLSQLPASTSCEALADTHSTTCVHVSISVTESLDSSECLLSTQLMRRLGIRKSHLVQLSTVYGDAYLEVRPARGPLAISDRLHVNGDVAAILGEPTVALRSVPLPPHGLPVLRSVSLAVVPQDDQGSVTALPGSSCVTPTLSSAAEWLSMFRRAFQHRVVYAHLRTTQRLFSHRVTVEVAQLVVEGRCGDADASAAFSSWGILTDATEIRLWGRDSASAGITTTSTGAAEGNSSVTSTEDRRTPRRCACTLVVGETGVGKSRWLRKWAAALPPQSLAETSSTIVKDFSRTILWVRVEELPQGEGSEVGTATVLRDVLEQARLSAPAAVILDDLHLLCARETSSAGSRWAMTLLAHVLAEELFDIGSQGHDVHVLASAPTLDSLDACLTGTTLFGGNVVKLEMPSSVAERLDCLHECLKELLPAERHGTPITEECFREVAARAHGFTQRDVHRLVETAGAKAFHARQAIIPTDEDLRAALDTVRPSSLKRFEVSVPKITWADIGGSAEAKRTLCEVVEWCLGKHRWMFTEFNLTPPKGVLLYGPPGCSKTMLAKALANESHMNFISVKGPEVFSKWVGDSEKAVRDIFHRARAASPCVVFIDELDGMCGHRGRGGVSDRVISQFLTELDGLPAAFEERKNALVFVAATNRPDSIDGAVLRPGRIDRRVYVGLPTLPERCAIAEIQFRGLPIAADLTASFVAAGTEGYTGAEVVAVVKEAALHAITSNAQASCVTTEDVVAALAQVRPRIKAKDIEWYQQWPHSGVATSSPA